jgi:hypothetical protein
MKRQSKRATVSIEKKDIFDAVIENKYQHYIFIGLIAVLLSVFFFRMAYLGYVPKSGDIMQWRGAAQVQMEYNEDNKDQALWNSNLFSGMPGYLITYPARIPFVKDLINLMTTYLVNWSVFFMFLSGLGVYVLMLSLGFKPMIAFISGIAFALSCHFIGLIEIGHNTKFRAVAYIPWIFWSISYIYSKRSVLGVGLTAMFLIMQLRENHIQITYYMAIMLIVHWIFNFFWHKKDFKLKEFGIGTLLVLLALLIAFLAIAQPYLSVWEYGQYTIRGAGGGLDTEYATGWSFHPVEIMTFVVPHLFGGVSPFYWGWMPFTQTSMYMGVLVFLLALIAIFDWKHRMVKMLTVVSLVALFFSFGRHFPLLSNLLLNHFPLYNKFRVPAMILVLVQFSMVIMAGYGLKTIFVKLKNNDERFQKLVLRLLIGSLVVLFLFIALSEAGVWNSLSFEHGTDAGRYEPRQMEFLRQERISQFVTSGMTSFGLIALFFVMTYLLLKKKVLTPYPFMILLTVLIVTDLMLVNRNHLDNLVHKSTIVTEFDQTEADLFLLEDEDLFRVYPLGGEFGQSRWAYHHETIGGYHGAKLRRYQDILDNSLHAEIQYRVPINWNVVNMLNVKYILSPVQLPFDNLSYAFYDRERRVTVYKVEDHFPRAWFVENVENLEMPHQRYRRLNSPEFNPAVTAITETELVGIEKPDSSHVSVVNHSLHHLEFDVSTDKRAFLAISEIYYPAGWNAYLNGNKTEIYPVNHILRGVVVPPGDHTLEMRFEPKTYMLSVILSLVGILSTIVLIIVGCYLYIKENYRGGIVYVFKDESD